jgi:hypothetical protein
MFVPNAQAPLEEGGMQKDIMIQFMRDCPVSISNINPVG